MLNNLALAYLWQKFPIFDEDSRRKQFSRDTDEVIEREIQTIPSMLKDSLSAHEKLEEQPDLTYSNFINKLFDVSLAKSITIKVDILTDTQEVQEARKVSSSLAGFPLISLVETWTRIFPDPSVKIVCQFVLTKGHETTHLLYRDG